MDCKEAVQVVKDIRLRFGREILFDKTKFLSAFNDFAPKLSKEKKMLAFALDEQINHIFLDADESGADKDKREAAVKNAMAKLTDEAWLSEQAAHMIVDCFAAALNWSSPDVIAAAVVQDKNISAEHLYIKGQQAYEAKNYREAVIFYVMSAVKEMASSQNELGHCYEYGTGVAENKSKAFEWYLKAAEQGYSLAQYNVGRCHDNGIGTTESKIKAFEWYLRAAEQGHVEAQIYVAYAYFHGIGIKSEIKGRHYSVAINKYKAFEWYLRAANQGHAYAQNEAGYCYYNGYGVAKDNKKAFEWYLKAAELNNSAAQFNAGWCCQYGIGVEVSKKRARYWYKRAVANGNTKAREKLWEL